MERSQRIQRNAFMVLACPGLCFAQGTMARAEVVGILAESRKIVSDNGIEDLRSVRINGATQWLSIRGRDRRNPILLVLHGGPGSPTMPAAYTFQSPWEDYFTVVQWDQRGTGKTYASNDPQALAQAWFQRVEAPSKRLVWSENSAHMVMQEEPGRFLNHLVTELRPLAVQAGEAAPDEVVVK